MLTGILGSLFGEVCISIKAAGLSVNEKNLFIDGVVAFGLTDSVLNSFAQF